MKHHTLPSEKEILLFNITFTFIFDPTNMMIARIALSGETLQQQAAAHNERGVA